MRINTSGNNSNQHVPMEISRFIARLKELYKHHKSQWIDNRHTEYVEPHIFDVSKDYETFFKYSDEEISFNAEEYSNYIEDNSINFSTKILSENYRQTAIISEDSTSNELYFDHLSRKFMSTEDIDSEIVILRVDLRSLLKNNNILNKDLEDILIYAIVNHSIYQKQITEESLKNLINLNRTKICLLIEGIDDVIDLLESSHKAQNLLSYTKSFNYILSLNAYPEIPLITDLSPVVLFNYGYSPTQINNFINLNYHKTNYLDVTNQNILDDVAILINENKFLLELSRHPLALDILSLTIFRLLKSNYPLINSEITNNFILQELVKTINQKARSHSGDSSGNILLIAFLKKISFEIIEDGNLSIDNLRNDALVDIKKLKDYNKIFPLFKITRDHSNNQIIKLDEEYRIALASHHIMDAINRKDFEPLKKALLLSADSEIYLKLLKNLILIANEEYKNNNDNIIKILEYIENFFNENLLIPIDKEFLLKFSICSALSNSGNQGYSSKYFDRIMKEIDKLIDNNLIEFKDIIIKLKYQSPELINNLLSIISNSDLTDRKTLAIEILSKIEITSFIQRSNIANKLINLAKNYDKDPNSAIAALDNLKYFKDINEVKRFFMESLSHENMIIALASIEYLASLPKASNLEILKEKLKTSNQVIYVSALKAIKRMEYLIDDKANFAYELLKKLIITDIPSNNVIYTETLHFLSPYKKEIQKYSKEFLDSLTVKTVDEDEFNSLLILIKNNFFDTNNIKEISEILFRKLEQPSYFSPFGYLTNANKSLLYSKYIIQTLNALYLEGDEEFQTTISRELNQRLFSRRSDLEKFSSILIMHAENIILANLNIFYGILRNKISSTENIDLLTQVNKILNLSYPYLNEAEKSDLFHLIKDNFILNLKYQSDELNSSYLIILKKLLENQDTQTIKKFLKELNVHHQQIGIDSNYLDLLHQFGSKQEIMNYHNFVFNEQNRNIFLTDKLILSIIQEIPSLIKSSKADTNDYVKKLIIFAKNSNSSELKIQAIKSLKEIFEYIDGNNQKTISHALLEIIDKSSDKELKLEILNFIKIYYHLISKHNNEIFDKFHAAILNEEHKTVINEFHSHLKKLKHEENRPIDINTHIRAFKDIIDDAQSTIENRISSIHLIAKFIEDLNKNELLDSEAHSYAEDLSLHLINLIASETNNEIRSHSAQAICEIYDYLSLSMKFKLIGSLKLHEINDDNHLNLVNKLLNDRLPRTATIDNFNTINLRAELDSLENKFIDYIHLNRLQQSISRDNNDVEYYAIYDLYKQNNLDEDKIEFTLKNKELIIHRILTIQNHFIKAAYLKLLISLNKDQIDSISFILKANLLKARSVLDLNSEIHELMLILDDHSTNDLAIGIKKYLESNINKFREIIDERENQFLLFEALNLQNNLNQPDQMNLALYKPDDETPQFINHESYLELPQFYRRHSESQAIRSSDLFTPVEFERSRSDTQTQQANAIFDIEAPRISFTPPLTEKSTLNSNLLLYGGIMKFSEIWESTKFLLNNYIPIIPALERYGLLPEYNQETQHYFVSSLYTFGAVSLGAAINVNPLLVGLSVALFWLKPCIHQYKNEMLDYIETSYSLTGNSRDYIDLALETGINFGTSLPFININSFLAASTTEKAYFILPMISQGAVSVISNKIHFYNKQTDSDGYISQIVPKIATTLVLFHPILAPHNAMTEVLLSKYLNEIKTIFITANAISSAHLTYISTEYLSKSLEEYLYKNTNTRENEILTIGESLLTE